MTRGLRRSGRKCRRKESRKAEATAEARGFLRGSKGEGKGTVLRRYAGCKWSGEASGRGAEAAARGS